MIDHVKTVMMLKCNFFHIASKMQQSDYMDFEEFGMMNDEEEDVEDIRERMFELAPALLLNRFLAMDLNKMHDMHNTFAHLGPLIKKLSLRDHGPSTLKFNRRVGKEAGRVVVEYCINGTYQNRDLAMGFSRYPEEKERQKVYELAKYLTNLKTLDCYKVRDKWGLFPVQRITQYCPKLERLIVVSDFIEHEDFNIGLIIPQHQTLKKIKINLQAYNHSGIKSIMSRIGRTMKEKTPNLALIEMEIEIDAYNEHWNYDQEAEFLSRFNASDGIYKHFKQMEKLKRCILSYSYLYEGVATLK